MKEVLLASFKSWFDHRSSTNAAALAFYTLFSMTPILMLAVAVAGYFFGAQAAQGEIIGQIQGLVGPSGAQAVQALLASARNPVTGLVATISAIVLLLVGMTSVFAELKDSLDGIWGEIRLGHSAVVTLLRTRLLAFGLVLVLAFLLLISLVISAALAMLESYVGSIWGRSLLFLSSASSIISFGVIVSLFAVIYKTLRCPSRAWRDAWVGAMFTAMLFSLGKYVIGLYLGNSDVASSFGAAGSIIALMLWVYYSAQIFFLGAEFTRQYALSFGSLQNRRKQ